MSRNNYVVKCLKWIQQVLHTSLCDTPLASNLAHMRMVFKLEMVHQLVESRIVQKLKGQRNFNTGCVDIKLHNDQIILIVIVQQQCPGIVPAGDIWTHAYIDPVIISMFARSRAQDCWSSSSSKWPLGKNSSGWLLSWQYSPQVEPFCLAWDHPSSPQCPLYSEDYIQGEGFA